MCAHARRQLVEVGSLSCRSWGFELRSSGLAEGVELSCCFTGIMTRSTHIHRCLLTFLPMAWLQESLSFFVGLSYFFNIMFLGVSKSGVLHWRCLDFAVGLNQWLQNDSGTQCSFSSITFPTVFIYFLSLDYRNSCSTSWPWTLPWDSDSSAPTL